MSSTVQRERTFNKFFIKVLSNNFWSHKLLLNNADYHVHTELILLMYLTDRKMWDRIENE